MREIQHQYGISHVLQRIDQQGNVEFPVTLRLFGLQYFLKRDLFQSCSIAKLVRQLLRLINFGVIDVRADNLADTLGCKVTGASTQTTPDVDHIGVTNAAFDVEEFSEVITRRLLLPRPIGTLIVASRIYRLGRSSRTASMNAIGDYKAQIHLLDSESSSGARLEFDGYALKIGDINTFDFSLVQIAFFVSRPSRADA